MACKDKILQAVFIPTGLIQPLRGGMSIANIYTLWLSPGAVYNHPLCHPAGALATSLYCIL